MKTLILCFFFLYFVSANSIPQHDQVKNSVRENDSLNELDQKQSHQERGVSTKQNIIQDHKALHDTNSDVEKKPVTMEQKHPNKAQSSDGPDITHKHLESHSKKNFLENKNIQHTKKSKISETHKTKEQQRFNQNLHHHVHQYKNHQPFSINHPNIKSQVKQKIKQKSKQHHRNFFLSFKSNDHSHVKKHSIDGDKQLFEYKISQMLKEIQIGKMNATTTGALNAYVEELFRQLRAMITLEDINNLSLPKESVKVRHSKHCRLSKGRLEEMGTIHLDGNVFHSYNPEEEKVTLGFPLEFNYLKIHYDYHVKSHLSKAHGGVNVLIKNARFRPVFSYYYNSGRLRLDHFDIKHAGHLTVSFTGHKHIDRITDSISEALTHNNHHKIMKIIQNIMEKVIDNYIGKHTQSIAKKMERK